jgi:putative ABC transport system permease protein
MTRFLAGLLGRMPIGWLQLRHSMARLAAAIAGVAFANILIFMQLGFMSGLVSSIELPYKALNADILISGSDANTLDDGSPLPRQRMYEALSVPGVAGATPLFLGRIDWRQSDGTVRGLLVLGIDPQATPFSLDEINDNRALLGLTDYAFLDRGTRNVPGEVFKVLADGGQYRFEARSRTLTIVGSFDIGGGFTADGHMIVSDQTFLKLFPQRSSGAPDHILVSMEPGANLGRVQADLQARLPAYDSRVQTIAQATERDQAFNTTQRPVGLIFGFGVIIGILVGMIIVYQVLSTDVADHLKEYATFKAIGYPQRFFLGIVFEEAVILALLGFIPGVIISTLLYSAVSAAASLPIEMTLMRPVYVLLGTIFMCTVSGAIATRRLARADPADLF